MRNRFGAVWMSVVCAWLVACSDDAGDGSAASAGNPAAGGGGIPTAAVGGTAGAGGVVLAGSGGAPPMATGGTAATGAGGTGGAVATTDAGAPMPDAGATVDAAVAVDAGAQDGAAASSGRVPFPAVGIDDLTSPGSFTAATDTSTGPGNGYNIYYPEELGQGGVLHPVLTWGNGATTTPDQYPLLPALASQGFVVIAARSSFVDGGMLRDGLDWMLEQNAVAGSPFEGVLDTERVASLGYSLGSLATFEIGTDPRLTTTVHISGGIMGGGDESLATAVDVPTAYFCDKDETGPNCDSDFAVVDDNPTFYGRVPGHRHVDYMFNTAFIDQMNAPVVGWLRWRLMDDQAMAVLFEGADCTLCTDSAWEVQKKNMD